MDRILVRWRHSITWEPQYTRTGRNEGHQKQTLKGKRIFVRLKKIWNSKSISRKTKRRLYKTIVVPVLLYGCETWKMNKGNDKRIKVFHNTCLSRILRIDWKDHVTTQELLEKANMKPLSREVNRRRWKVIGHILRKDQKDDCNIAMTWAPEGERKTGITENDLETDSGKEKMQVGDHGKTQELQQPTGKSGVLLWEPYAPRGA